MVLVASGAGLIYLLVRHGEQFWESANDRKGREGEREVRGQLRRLGSSDYRQFADLIIPTRNGASTTEIDHVVVSPFGLFVIETKKYDNCMITAGPDLKDWRVDYSSGHTKSLYSPIRQNRGHVTALSEYLGIDRAHFHNIVVFGGNCGFATDPGPEVFRGGGYVDHIESFRAAVLDGHLVERVNAALTRQAKLSRQADLRRTHIANVGRR